MYVTLRPPADGSVKYLCDKPDNFLVITRILKHLSEIKTIQDSAAPLVLYFVAQHSEGNIDMSEGKPLGVILILDRWWSNVFRDVRERKEIGDIVKARGGLGKRKWTMEAYWRWYIHSHLGRRRF